MKRLLKEWKTYEKEKPEDIFLSPISDSDLFEWFAIVQGNINWKFDLQGPKDTPYEGGRFQIKLSVPSNYPLSPPKATFISHVFHPNVHFKVISLSFGKTSPRLETFV